MLRFAGFQDGVESNSAVGQVFTHAEQEAVQMVTQLDWLRVKVDNIIKTDSTNEKKRTHLYQEFLPDFEVGENQLTSRESYPVNTPASVEQTKLVKD